LNTKIKLCKILHSQIVEVEAYEGPVRPGAPKYTSTLRVDGELYSQIGTAIDAVDYGQYPAGSNRRIKKINELYNIEYERALKLIYDEYPFLAALVLSKNARINSGRVIVSLSIMRRALVHRMKHTKLNKEELALL